MKKLVLTCATVAVLLVVGLGGVLAVNGVPIDVKPWSFPNSINLKSNGVLPVAVLSNPATGFDATTVVVGTVKLHGVPGTGGSATPVRWACQDVFGDGALDLVLKFRKQDLPFTAETQYAVVTGEWEDANGVRHAFEGFDFVRIVPGNDKGKK